MALRLANADVAPMDFRAYADRLREFVKETIARAQPPDRTMFSPLEAASDRFANAARIAAARADTLLAAERSDAAAMRTLDVALMRAERGLIDRDGIPGRPWYRHVIYAPKATYAPEVLPGVAEAIESGNRARLADQVRRLTAALDRASAILSGPATR